jgi:hypothetical protein
MTKVFVSYSRKQAAWVRDCLVPVLRAGGADVLIDAERFRLGHRVIGEMNSTQDQAERHLLCLSDDYLASDYCRHEMDRALAVDPHGAGIALPLRLNGVTVPDPLESRLYGDFTDETRSEPWAKLLAACDADLGIDAPRWLAARDQTLTYLERDQPQSVNLVVRVRHARWKGLLTDIMDRLDREIPWIDLEDGVTTTRPDFLNEILAGLGIRRQVRESHDLVDFSRIIREEEHPAVVALVHFERIERFQDDIDLAAVFRNLIMERRKLVLLVQSHDPFAKLLPKAHKLSDIDIKTVELA